MIVLVGMVVRKSEGVHSAAEAVPKMELEVDAVKEPDIGVASVTEVVVVYVYV
jgi:hypothetical protein